MRPREKFNLWLARALWYLDQVRVPLEWLLFVWALTKLVQPRGFEEVANLVTMVLFWLLLAALVVQFIHALTLRGVGGLRADKSGLRLRTLKLIAGWSVLLGLGLDLTSRYAGEGVIYSWMVWGWQLLTIPVALLLIHWWRLVIFTRLEETPEQSSWVKRLSGNATGTWSYPAAVIGATYLIWRALVHFVVRLLSGRDTGRRVLAVLVRREVAKEGIRGGQTDETPIGDELMADLLAARHVQIDSIARAELDYLCRRIDDGRGGALAVIGERGSGKSVFMARVAERVGECMRVIECPTGGYERLEETLAAAFDVERGENLGARLVSAIKASGVRVIGIDDVHLLPRPWMGGQVGLDRLSTLDAALDGEMTWVLGIDRRAWEYVSLARSERALLSVRVELPTWSEEQLAELIKARAEAVDIEPNYQRLVLPRQLDSSESDDVDERNRYGYARILWELSSGNPEVAIVLFAESLRLIPGGEIILRLPQPTSPDGLNVATSEALHVLRVLVQCDIASTDDISKNLRVSIEQARSVIRFCAHAGWVDDVPGGHQISSRWFRTITRGLVRRNLIPR